MDAANKICASSLYAVAVFPKPFAKPPTVTVSVISLGPESPCMANSAKGFSIAPGQSYTTATVIWGWASPAMGFCGAAQDYAGTVSIQWTAIGQTD